MARRSTSGLSVGPRPDPSYVEDPFDTWERSVFLGKHRIAKKDSKRKGSGIDSSVPEPFSWSKREGAVTTLQINSRKDADNIDRYNRKVDRTVRQLTTSPRRLSPSGRRQLTNSNSPRRSVSPTRAYPLSAKAGHTGHSINSKYLSRIEGQPMLSSTSSMTNRMFESLRNLPDDTFRKIADVGLTPSMSATLLLVGRGDDQPRGGGSPMRSRSTDFLRESESLIKRMARKRGGMLVGIDSENTKITRRLASPKRAQHGSMLDPVGLKNWHSKQSKHMRRGCQLPYVMGAQDSASSSKRLSMQQGELAALADSADNAAHVLDAFQVSP